MPENKTSSLYIRFLLLLLCLLPFSYDESFAFSFKKIEIKSKFGDPFLAEIHILNDGNTGLKVDIGSSDDYKMLSLERKSVVNNLLVDPKTLAVAPGESLVRVYSPKPLFYPSFDLVVKAKSQGNTIIENFFLAVDFRTNLNISVVDKKKKTPKKKRKKAKARPLIAAKPAEQPEQGVQSDTASSAPKSEKIIVIKQQPAKAGGPEKEVIKEEPIQEEKIVKKPAKEKPREKMITTEETEKKPAIAAKVSKPDPAPSSKKGKLLTAKTKWGDTLFKVAKQVNNGKGSSQRVVAALWLLNKEEFLHGNMNNLKKGTRLDYTGLEEVLKKVSHREAKIIIENQWQEFLFIKMLLADKGKEEEKKSLREVFLPGEVDLSQEDILKIVHDWKDAWEEESLEKYIGFYSLLFQAQGKKSVLSVGEWKEHKRKIFEDQEGFSISIEQVRIRPARDHYLVNFYQNYRSDRIDSFGVKTLDFVKEEGSWKIFREGFQGKSSRESEIGKEFPYVVQVASFKDLKSALEKANHLRRLGYTAYLVPVNIPDKGNFYRVAVDRFATKEEADKFASSLIRLQLIPNAVSAKMPYSIELAVFGSEADAFHRIRELRSEGYSAYIFSVDSEREKTLQHKVLLGAYGTYKQAAAVSRLLKNDGIAHRIIRP